MALIRLEGMEFYAHHGCFAEERRIGTHFLVDVKIEVDTTQAEITDDLSATVSYLDVYQLVKAEMEQPSYLLENVAHRIADSLRRHYPAVTGGSVKVSKLAPPLGGQLAAASVEITI